MSTAVLIGILLLLSYFGLIYFAAKGGNLMLGFLVMAIIWVALGAIGGKISWNVAMTQVFEGGPESWGATAVIVIFGSWFGRILVDTGIAATIIRKTTELGGDKPLFTTVLLSIVTGIIFSSAFGAGAVVAIGVIVLPILLSLGVPKPLAVSSYLMSVGSGMYLNITLFKQMQGFFPGFQYSHSYIRFGAVAMGVQLLVIILMLAVMLRKKGVNRAWAAQSAGASSQNAPALALITPLIPVVLAIFFNWQPVPAFIVAVFYALLVCGKLGSLKELEKIVTKTFYDGVVDVASLLGFLFILPMFNKVSGIDAFFFKSLLGGVMPTSALTICILFAIIAPLGLFRGPLTVFGAGSATLGILNAIAGFTPALLFPLIYIPTITMNISACPTQSWNLWSLNYSKVSVKDFLKTGIFWAWLICIINTAVVFIMFGK